MLSVLIERVDVAARGVMAVSDGFGVLRERLEGMSFQFVDIEDGAALVSGAVVPVRPMIGVIGVAPDGPAGALRLAGRARRQHGHASDRRGRDGLPARLRTRRLAGCRRPARRHG